MGKKTKSSEFVSCVSCFYCSKVSFESNDSAAYAAHLRAAHNIVKNVEALLRLTKQLQGGDSSGKYIKLLPKILLSVIFTLMCHAPPFYL